MVSLVDVVADVNLERKFRLAQIAHDTLERGSAPAQVARDVMGGPQPVDGHLGQTCPSPCDWVCDSPPSSGAANAVAGIP